MEENEEPLQGKDETMKTQLILTYDVSMEPISRSIKKFIGICKLLVDNHFTRNLMMMKC